MNNGQFTRRLVFLIKLLKNDKIVKIGNVETVIILLNFG